MKVTKLTEKPELDSEDIAFTLAPRLNAAGRLGQAQLAIELLTTEDEQRADSLAEYLHELNGTRTTLERSIYLAAKKQCEEQFDAQNDAAFVLAHRGWHAGVIGIVAGRLAEKYHRPVVIVAFDELASRPGIGSARSAPGVNLHEAFHACAEHLVSYGGHAAAAGMKIDESNLDAFREDFCQFVSGQRTDADMVAKVWIDAETPLSALTMQTVKQIEQLAPFGEGNRRPTLCTTDVHIVGEPRRIGGGGRHLSLNVRQYSTNMRAVAFGGGDWSEQLEQTPGPLDIAFRPVINHFRGRSTVEIQLVDWRPAQKTAHTVSQ